MKPLIRWNLGQTSQTGLEILTRSISLAKNIFSDFDFLLCHNQLSDYNLQYIEQLNIEKLNCGEFANDLPMSPLTGYHVHWKLYPPRVRLESYEIIIDNDILLTNRPTEVDLFLEDDATLLYQGLHDNTCGQFQDFVPTGVRINSGIYGMPPGYDFLHAIENMLAESKVDTWKDYFDEQGLVTACLLRYGRYYIISQISVPIIEPSWNYKIFTTPLTKGFHFIGANRDDLHKGWTQFNVGII